MSQDNTASNSASPAVANTNDLPDHVYLVSYPKIVYLYPTVLAALFCGIFMWAKGGIPQEEIREVPVPVAAAAGLQQPEVQHRASIARAAFGMQADETETPAASSTASSDSTPTPEPALDSTTTSDPPTTDAADAAKDGTPAASDPGDVKVEDAPKGDVVVLHTYHNVCARIFLVVLALNMVVISFDFPRTTSLTWFFAIVAIVIGMWFLLTLNRNLAPQIVSVLLKIKPAANASFYLIFSGIMIFLYICVLVSRRFDFWEVKGNELLHHHGFLSNLERFSAPNLRIDKEINDVFEYLLLRSGRLIIHASNERRAIVLENILFINAKEERITKMLGALQVRVRTERE